MKSFTLLLLSILFFGCQISPAQVQYNGNMEQLSADKTKAAGWLTYFQAEQQKAYPVKIDSLVKQDGKYSLSIEKVSNESRFGVIDYPILKSFTGNKIQLRGYIKTENVKNGYAGLWLRIDGTPAFDNMQNRGVTGTTDWKEYVIDLPYDDAAAINIHGGALLVGDGKVWVDNLRLFINGKPIEKATKVLTKAGMDTAYNIGSKIDTILLSKQQVTNLTALGQVWGFLKYHHPDVAKGNHNWDAELFRVMPQVLKAADNAALSKAIEKWVDGFGVPSLCGNCKITARPDEIKLKPDYGLLFNKQVLSASLTQKLQYILDNRNTGDNYYIDMARFIGNPVFTHEAAYSQFTYPDAGYRLLTLYRYWSMINYFYPYKYLIGEDWNNVLADCIPKFATAANASDYALNTLALIARIHDTHANIWSYNKAITAFKGKYRVPFDAKFIEDKLVVTGYLNDTLNVKQLVKVGDVIETINGQPVTQLIEKYLPYTPASNYDTQLRDIPGTYLLRGNTVALNLELIRDGQPIKSTVTALPAEKINYSSLYDIKSPGYYVIDKEIGYVYPGRYHNKDLSDIKKLFKDTRGIIIDMRCYPSEFMPFTFVPYIKTGNARFVKFTKAQVNTPGLMVISDPLSIKPDNDYKGKVVVIVNAVSQSQAEYTTMAFQSSPNVTVIGSTTAGADGNVSAIILPGAISTMISGLGIYYPDGTDTQRKGVKIDVAIKPTIKGIKEGRDELLERAKAIILTNDDGKTK
ncbi:S41 family peptidase [Mucilaginibacter ginsenosidivorax]|uniref:Peptidase S41 n=1 Tax=Mucilaginibacter ginsenosidivorax TaxID=862126 RepID=A0A5B8W8D3_9SPHI|nr:S41 family peptidase [Mucilaginibacter ginsenosidivorax]QEC80270.1 peptidase S41 [Mucilaginibacter ginsenosidivorax]